MLTKFDYLINYVGAFWDDHFLESLLEHQGICEVIYVLAGTAKVNVLSVVIDMIFHVVLD